MQEIQHARPAKLMFVCRSASASPLADPPNFNVTPVPRRFCGHRTQATGPSAEAVSSQCAVTIDYEAKLLQGSSANASSVPFVGSLSIQNTSPAVRTHVVCHA